VLPLNAIVADKMLKIPHGFLKIGSKESFNPDEIEPEAG
jgi:hypothetical protein